MRASTFPKRGAIGSVGRDFNTPTELARPVGGAFALLVLSAIAVQGPAFNNPISQVRIRLFGCRNERNETRTRTRRDRDDIAAGRRHCARLNVPHNPLKARAAWAHFKCICRWAALIHIVTNRPPNPWVKRRFHRVLFGGTRTDGAGRKQHHQIPCERHAACFLQRVALLTVFNFVQCLATER